MSLTFNSVSYDLLGEVGDGTPGVAIISAGDVAQSGHVLPCNQLVGLWGVTQNSDEEQKESARELIIDRARVHGSVDWQESSAQNTDVLPLQTNDDWEESQEIQKMMLLMSVWFYLKCLFSQITKQELKKKYFNYLIFFTNFIFRVL